MFVERGLAFARDRHKRQKQPVTYQAEQAGDDQVARPKMNEEAAGEQVAQCQALQHAQEANVRPFFGEPAVVHEPHEIEQNRAAKQAFIGGPAAAALEPPLQRKHQRHADQKSEQRKNQIIKREPDPIRMAKLGFQKRTDISAQQASNRDPEPGSADQPEHVETAQHINGHDPPRSVGLGH